MDKPVFIVEMPALSDQDVIVIENFLWDVIQAFESRYFHQLQRHHRNREEQFDE